MPKFRLFLRSVCKTGPDILLPHRETVLIGRGPQTKIKDSRLSRHQLKVTADYDYRTAKLIQVGGNASTVSGNRLDRGSSCAVGVGEKIELLEGEYTYVLAMEENKKPEEEEMLPAASNSPRAAPIIPHTNHWSQGLLAAMSDPSLQLYEDDRIVIINDRYPKARHHFLVLPRKSINDLASLNSDHLELVEHMQEKAEERAVEKHRGVEFRFGYHAIPSMSHLHLHAISQDFDSPCLKNKKHWNSFNTEYFVPFDKVMSNLKERGEVQLMAGEAERELLKKSLKCHKCDYVPKNLPDLKAHILKKHYS